MLRVMAPSFHQTTLVVVSIELAPGNVDVRTFIPGSCQQDHFFLEKVSFFSAKLSLLKFVQGGDDEQEV